MKREDIRLPSKAAGREIHAVIWEPEEDPCAVLQITHGMAEYIGRYEPFAAYLTERGIAVAGHDHLGHGESIRTKDDLGFFTEERGDEIVISDMKTVTHEAKRRFPGVPVFLLGHSMGSFFARRYLAVAGGELSGAIVMGTGFIPAPVASIGYRIAVTVCRAKGPRALSPTLDNLVLGGSMKAFPSEGKMAWLSTDPALVSAYEADPLCGFPFTAGAYRDFFAVMKSIAREEDFEGIRRTLPILITSGEKDPVGGKAAVEKVAALYRKLDFSDVTAKVFPGDRHEILNERDKAAVYQFIGDWIEKRIRK